MSPPLSPSKVEVLPKTIEETPLLFQALSAKGRAPTRGSPKSAGYDLYS